MPLNTGKNDVSKNGRIRTSENSTIKGNKNTSKNDENQLLQNSGDQPYACSNVRSIYLGKRNMKL